jgi:hypothetical protein
MAGLIKLTLCSPYERAETNVGKRQDDIKVLTHMEMVQQMVAF